MIRILIVEDNKDMTMILAKRLEHEGFAVDAVADGYALLSLLRDGMEPDALVLDLMIPGRSGLELLNTVITKWKATKVFIFSAHSEYEKRCTLKEYNISGYICKSDGIDKLIEMIKSELKGSDENGRS
jgi:DNA-binding response OmpR family regulator